MTSSKRPIRAGFAPALLAATRFGLTRPVVQRFGRGVGPFATAALLYVGAGLVALVTRQGDTRGAAPQFAGASPHRDGHCGRDGRTGVARVGTPGTSGLSASLALNVEAVFTRLLYRNHVGR